MVVTACSSEEEFQVLAMRLAARVLLPGTGWIAFTQLIDLVSLMMDLLGKSVGFIGGSTNNQAHHCTLMRFSHIHSSHRLVDRYVLRHISNIFSILCQFGQSALQRKK